MAQGTGLGATTGAPGSDALRGASWVLITRRARRVSLLLLAVLLLAGVLGGCAASPQTELAAEPAPEAELEPDDAVADDEPAEGEDEDRTAEDEDAATPEPEPEPEADPEPEPEPSPDVSEDAAPSTPAWTVVNVVDGDTVDVRADDGTQERIRVIGIDTPERGECGFGEAAAALAAMTEGRVVDLVDGARDDRDRYGRLLRYLDIEGLDAGLRLIEEGYAIARYDSRDGYGRHPREDAYVAADAATAHVCPAAAPEPAEPAPAKTATAEPGPAPSKTEKPAAGGPGSGPGGAWKNCTEARAAGAAPVHRGDPGYGSHLDRDNDGIGCE
ncbi:thermonuclease family protein [Egicoccus sp. AB-alg2]|uniref:thermonuclease family protein n=1 Tax=Egicoccus sp. AB-alg2 TaxID=3242693 RepID=UPI00359E1E19